MKKTSEEKRPTAEEIADLADAGEDISRFFTNRGRMVPPVHSIRVDFSSTMLEELDNEAATLSVSREAIIKSLLRKALDDRHLVAEAQRRAS